MYTSPHTHLAISRERHEDMLRDARNRELARLVQRDRPSLIARVRRLFPDRGAKHEPVVKPV
jgi:hypothetical protein